MSSTLKRYEAPALADHGDVATITATLGDPFTGDVSFDIDGNILAEGPNSINQCPTQNNVECFP